MSIYISNSLTIYCNGRVNDDYCSNSSHRSGEFHEGQTMVVNKAR